MQKLSMKQLVCAVAVAGACASASAVEQITVSSTTTDLGTLAISPGTNAFSGYAPVGGFMDYFLFNLPANGGSGYGVVNFPVNTGSVSFNTIFSSLALFSNPNGTVGVGDALLTSVSNSGNALSLTWGPTAGGPMYLVVSGQTNGSVGGLYSGAISVSPIPEPETWAMMLIGAGLVGFRLRTRSKKTAANRFA